MGTIYTGFEATDIGSVADLPNQRHAVLPPPLLPKQPVQHDVGKAVAVVGPLALDALDSSSQIHGCSHVSQGATHDDDPGFLAGGRSSGAS